MSSKEKMNQQPAALIRRGSESIKLSSVHDYTSGEGHEDKLNSNDDAASGDQQLEHD